MTKTVHLDAPDIGLLEKEHVIRAIESGYVSTFGPLVGEFEKRAAAFLGAPRAVALQSGTAALHMALYVLGVGLGDEVILPATTFAASLHAVMYTGATPVIVDVDLHTWCLSPEALKAAITPRTKAVMPVHLYGNLCDMPSIGRIAAEAGVFVVEDATESLGATLSGRHSGMIGDIGCLSFNGNKLMTTGGGGMMLARSPKVLDRASYLINQSNPRGEMEGYQEVGFNYRMPNLNAALGIAQWQRLGDFLAAKRAFHEIYRERLGQEGYCSMQVSELGAEPSWWFTAVLFNDYVEARRVQDFLAARNVPTRRIFRPLYSFPYAGAFQRGACVNAEMIYERGVCLPSSTLNSADSVHYVCSLIREAVGVKGGAAA